MPIPKTESLLLPILNFLADRAEHSLRDIIEHTYKISDLSENNKKQFLTSCREPVFQNRIRWAVFILRKAGLVESPKRGFSIITIRGIDILQENRSELNLKYLKSLPDFVKFLEGKKKSTKSV